MKIINLRVRCHPIIFLITLTNEFIEAQNLRIGDSVNIASRFWNKTLLQNMTIHILLIHFL